ncbi:hypothetical protein [Arthrobacter sp. SRS-W-1-2016]|jgi:hypothetical protein|nr:hypothetical protein [Arthrobacter sp. SRS-W-1-2016]
MELSHMGEALQVFVSVVAAGGGLVDFDVAMIIGALVGASIESFAAKLPR